MNSSFIQMALVMYGTAIGTLWLATWVMSPKGYEFNWWRAPLAAVLMTASGTVLRVMRAPLIGPWYALLLIIVYIIMAMGVLRLPFWRSTAVAAIYITVVATVYSHFFARAVA